MNNRNKNNLTARDPYGTRSDTLRQARGMSVAWIGVAITLLAVVLDFTNVFSRYDLLMAEGSILLLVMATIASVIILDVPMYVAGCVLKEMRQGIRPIKEARLIIIGAITAFAVVALLNLWLSLESARYMLEDPAATATSVFSDAETGSNSILVGALLLGTQPILTSIASFVVGLYCSDPLQQKVVSLSKALNAIYSHIHHANQSIAEIVAFEPELYDMAVQFHSIQQAIATAKTAEERSEVISRLDNFVLWVKSRKTDTPLLGYALNDYRTAVQGVYAQEHQREQATMAALQKHLNDPDAISRVSERSIMLADAQADPRIGEIEPSI